MNATRKLAVPCILIALGLCGCPSTDREVRVQTNADAVVHARTYALGSLEQAPPRYRSSSQGSKVAGQHLGPMVEDALRSKGYVAATSVADANIVIMFAVGRRDREKPPAPAHHGQEDATGGDDPDEEYVEGAVVIDALDGKTGARVWHGFGRTEIDPNVVDDALLRKTVNQILARFPTAEPAAH